MNNWNSHAKFGFQTQACREINKITHWKSHQTLSLTSILSFVWNADGESEYQFHRKPNQTLKYLNKGSTHINATFNAIPSGIFYRLAKLTSRTKKNTQMKIYEIYQGHAKSLSKAGLAPKIFPTLKEIWRKMDASKINNDSKRENRSGGWERNTYFCIGFSNIWRENIYNIIKNFLIPTVLNGCVHGFPIIGSQT